MQRNKLFRTKKAKLIKYCFQQKYERRHLTRGWSGQTCDLGSQLIKSNRF
jgi:hypothetical protein